MSMGMSMRMNLSQTMRMQVALPPTNWSLLDSYRDEGDTPLRFKKI